MFPFTLANGTGPPVCGVLVASEPYRPTFTPDVITILVVTS
jgi:hypothetical protein